MKRWRLFSTLAALLTGVVMTLATTTQVAAQQNPDCCIYFVDVQGVSNSCFPFRLWTLWHPSGVLGPIAITSNGTTQHRTPPNNCPPAEIFRGASLAGPLGPWATPSERRVFRVNDCCLEVSIDFSDFGCVVIHVRQVNGPC